MAVQLLLDTKIGVPLPNISRARHKMTQAMYGAPDDGEGGKEGETAGQMGRRGGRGARGVGGGKGQTTARGRGEDEAGHAGGEQRRESGRGREALVTRDGRFCAKK